MNFELRSDIGKALVPIVLTAVGTLAFQCGKYIFFDYPSEVAEVRETYKSELKRTTALQAYTLNFSKTVSAALSRGEGRKNSFLEIRRSFPLGRDQKALSSIHSKASELAQEAISDYGTLLAFTPDGKYITQADRDSAVGLEAADAALWRVLYRCSKSGMALPEANACNDEILDAEFERSKALALAISANENHTFTDSMLEIDQELRRQKYEARINRMWRWYSASIAGFVFSVVAYCLLFLVAAGSRVTFSRGGIAKAGARPDSACEG